MISTLSHLIEYAGKCKEKLLVCEVCGLPYVTSREHKKSVCIHCDIDRQNNRPPMLNKLTYTCPECGGEFTPRAVIQVYCGMGCRRKAEEKRRRRDR